MSRKTFLYLALVLLLLLTQGALAATSTVVLTVAGMT